MIYVIACRVQRKNMAKSEIIAY